MATPNRRGRQPKSKRLWCTFTEGATPDPRRRFLSWADAVDSLDIDRTLTLQVEAKTYAESRIVKGCVVKAASRRFIALDTQWDGEWVYVKAVS